MYNIRLTTDDERRKTPRVWNKFPAGELKMIKGLPQIFYVLIVFGYYFANNVGGATI